MNLFSRFFALAAAVLLLLPSCHGTLDTPAPVNIIFETDMGNDIDDAMALDMLYKWVDEGKVNLLAIMINKEGTTPAEFVDIMNTFYGHQVPIGVRCGDAPAKTGGVNFAQVISDMKDDAGQPLFARSMPRYDTLPDAVSLYRQLLSEMPDKSVKIISVGFLGNLGALLESDCELIEKKVISLTTMGGWFTAPNAEFNISGDLAASRKVFAGWPTEIVTSPFEVGAAICYPGESIEKDLDWGIPHPMREGYLAYCPMPHDRPCWDLTATLYAVEGAEWFTVSEPGIIDVSEDGLTTFTPQSDGRHRYISVTPEQAEAIKTHFVEVITQKPLSLQ
ncbi:MAG: nucleoside hydrolase [Bacteroidales bacterium]|nr:nucleoside hydrolase [Bacteroidales bacterium]